MASLVDNLTNFADQLTQLQLPDGTVASMELIYNGATERWTANISYDTASFVVNSLNFCCFPNLLRQWKNVIPFGIACVTADQTDPFNINDFSSGRAQVYLLTAADVASVESTVFGAQP